MEQMPTSQQEKKWWSNALSLFGQISGWIVVPIIAAVFLGDWLDDVYGQDNFYLYVCVAVAFVLTNVGLFINVVKFSRQMEKEASKKNNSNQSK